MKLSPLWTALGLSLAGVAFAAVSCGPGRPPCAMTCQGCCTSNNICVSGQTTLTCGKGGESCVECNVAQGCTNGACVERMASGGGGGGGGTFGVGGGGGTSSFGGGVGGGVAGGVGGGGCLVISMIGSGADQGGFTSDSNYMVDEEDAYVSTAGSSGTLTNLLWISEYYTTGLIPDAPRTVELGATTWASCADCVEYSVDCDTTTCAEDYLAQSGTLQIDSHTLDAGAGVFTGSITSIHLVQWDGIYNNTGTDAPTPGGKCIDITMGTFNATWP